MKDTVLGFPGGTSGKEPDCQCRRQKSHGFDPWVGEIPWRRAWQPTPVFLPGESHGQRSLMGYKPWGHRVGHNWVTFTFTFSGKNSTQALTWLVDIWMNHLLPCLSALLDFLPRSEHCLHGPCVASPVRHMDQAGRCPELGVGAGVGICISAPHRLTPSLSCVCLLCPHKIDDRQRIHRAPPLQSSSE